jgi:Na+/melibiose symporter-like transporter
MVTAMTERLDERTALQSYKSIWGGVGSGLSTILATVLAGEGIGFSYSTVSIIIAVVALITMSFICKNGVERCGGEQDETFTVRKMSGNIGVERTWAVNSPVIASIEVLKFGKVRRNKIYYLRNRSGKSARIKQILK